MKSAGEIGRERELICIVSVCLSIDEEEREEQEDGVRKQNYGGKEKRREDGQELQEGFNAPPAEGGRTGGRTGGRAPFHRLPMADCSEKSWRIESRLLLILRCGLSSCSVEIPTHGGNSPHNLRISQWR